MMETHEAQSQCEFSHSWPEMVHPGEAGQRVASSVRFQGRGEDAPSEPLLSCSGACLAPAVCVCPLHLLLQVLATPCSCPGLPLYAHETQNLQMYASRVSRKQADHSPKRLCS